MTNMISTKPSSIRKFVYAALLAVTSLGFVPTLASAQEAHGKFTLTHDVHWQTALVPAGEYRFSFDANGPAGVLVLSKLSGARGGFLMTVHDTDEIRGSGPGLLLLESTSGGSYVSALQLPEVGMTLRFVVPAASAEKQMARAVTAELGAAR
jgi:hypothetical protein